jgi:DNA invertase Pin-like site-specific DNA recombinase
MTTTKKKRVYILYRASTMAQVEKSDDKLDIPQQKHACREFVKTHPGWEIAREIYENGVSGYKVSAEKRDGILTMKKDALAGKFEVLLVFLFDRLGRIEAETPYVVQWFVDNGIEVWSVSEGQRKIETHADKLMNYVTFWQAEGESLKTSLRTSSGMGAMALEGHFKGGVPAFGYRAERLGRVNKRGHEVSDLVVDAAEAAVVRLVFDRYVNAGMGTQTIAAHLAGLGHRNRKGERFVSPSILNMLKNVQYRGVVRSGESRSEPFEHLRIIDDETFFRAQELMAQRSNAYAENRTMPKTVLGHSLLSGNVFCGHCGGRVIASTAAKRYSKADGSDVQKRFWTYRCYNGMRHAERCDGLRAYVSDKIDEAVDGAIREIFARCKGVSVSELLDAELAANRKAAEASLAKAEATLRKLAADGESLKLEIADALAGRSSFTPEMLRAAIEANEARRAEAEAVASRLSAELEDQTQQATAVKARKQKLLDWADLWDDCPPAEKKMICANLITRVTLFRGGVVEIDFAEDLRSFLTGYGEDTPTQQETIGERIAV